MATSDLVRPIFYARLNTDSHPQTVAAGANWEQQLMGFYYSDEISVDLAVKMTMITILTFEHATLAEDFWNQLRVTVNRGTLAGDAVDVIAQISSAATHG